MPQSNPYRSDRPFCLKCWAIAVLLISVIPKYAIAVLSRLMQMRHNGYQAKSGMIVYRCKCGFTCTEGDRPPLRPTLGNKSMTQVERNRRYRERKRMQIGI